VLSTTVGTGVISANFTPADVVANTTLWATRFLLTYEEYRVVACRITIRMFSSTNPGLICFFFDEKSATLPSATVALEKASVKLSASANNSERIMMWRPTDFTDLNYNAVGTSFSPVNFKVYTDTSNFGSSAVVTPYLMLEISSLVQFRGFKPV
jgi:hypothetical protein